MHVLVEVTNGLTEKTSATESNLETGIFVPNQTNVTRDSGIEIYADAVVGSTIIEITGQTDRVSQDITLTVTAPNANVVSVDQVSPMLDGGFHFCNYHRRTIMETRWYLHCNCTTI